MSNAIMNRQTGLPVIAARNARVLILGSYPGQISLERQEYYANPRNAFWRILHAVVGVEVDQPYEKRVGKVCDAGLALWDVCAVAIRPGSLDSALRRSSVMPNDFTAFFGVHRHIERICFNGQMAAGLFRRLVCPNVPRSCQQMPLVILPSSSPAYAAMPFAVKVERWRDALRAGDS